MLDWLLTALILLAGLAGCYKGFLKSLIGLCGNILALFVSYVFASPVTVWISMQFGAVEVLAGPVRRLLPMPESFSQVIASFAGMGQLYTYLDQLVLPDSVKQSILSAVQAQVDTVGAGVYATMADMIVNAVATSILHGLVFIALWALGCIVLFFVSHVLAGLVHLVPVVGLLDRLSGMLVSLALAAITLLILYKGISILGLMEGSIFAQSQILHFCSEFLNSGM